MSYREKLPAIAIKGPSHLLQTLEGLDINFWKYKSIIVWLNENRQLVEISTADTIIEHPFAIQLEISDTDSLASTEQQPNLPKETHLLDHLVLSKTAWRSAICTDMNCCPETGRAWPVTRPEPGQSEFEELINRSELDGFLINSVIQYFANLQIRDAWLLYIVSNPNQLDTRIAKWVQIITSTETHEDSDSLMTLLSILKYLQGETDAASKHVQKALHLNPEYNLARLIERALTEQAPIELILNSFRAVTYERLNLQPPNAA